MVGGKRRIVAIKTKERLYDYFRRSDGPEETRTIAVIDTKTRRKFAMDNMDTILYQGKVYMMNTVPLGGGLWEVTLEK